MTTDILEITPDLAALFLEERNTGNRRLRESHVRKLAADMKAGRWKETHQGIAFSKAGRLLDGQHRLAAVVEAGVPVRMMVTQGVSEDSYIAMDQGANRSVADATGEDWLTNQVGATCRAMMEAAGLVDRSTSITVGQVREFALRFEDQVRAVDALFIGMGNGLNKAPIRAAVTNGLVAGLDPTVAKGFVEVFRTGIMANGGDVAAVLLRNLVVANVRHKSGGSGDRRDLYLKACRALLAYRDQDALSRLYACQENPFELPEPVRTRKRRPRGAA